MAQASAREISNGIVQMYSQKSSRILDDITTDDFIFWDNVDTRNKPKSVIMAEFDQYISQFKSVDANVLRLEELSDGFLQQHVVIGTLQNNQAAKDHHACLIVRTRDGKVSRIDEYCDSAAG